MSEQKLDVNELTWKVAKYEARAWQRNLLAVLIPAALGAVWLYYTHNAVNRAQTDLTAARSELESSQKDLEKANTALTNANKVHREKIDSLADEIAGLKSTIDRLEKETEPTKIPLEPEEDPRDRQLEEAAAEIDRLKQQLGDMESQLASARDSPNDQTTPDKTSPTIVDTPSDEVARSVAYYRLDGKGDPNYRIAVLFDNELWLVSPDDRYEPVRFEKRRRSEKHEVYETIDARLEIPDVADNPWVYWDRRSVRYRATLLSRSSLKPSFFKRRGFLPTVEIETAAKAKLKFSNTTKQTYHLTFVNSQERDQTKWSSLEVLPGQEKSIELPTQLGKHIWSIPRSKGNRLKRTFWVPQPLAEYTALVCKRMPNNTLKSHGVFTEKVDLAQQLPTFDLKRVARLKNPGEYSIAFGRILKRDAEANP